MNRLSDDEICRLVVGGMIAFVIVLVMVCGSSSETTPRPIGPYSPTEKEMDNLYRSIRSTVVSPGAAHVGAQAVKWDKEHGIPSGR